MLSWKPDPATIEGQTGHAATHGLYPPTIKLKKFLSRAVLALILDEFLELLLYMSCFGVIVL